MEQNTAKIIKRLKKDGWYLERHGGEHDVYKHPDFELPITVPRHTKLSIGVAGSIHRAAKWPR